jgi:hypothetical protein
MGNGHEYVGFSVAAGFKRQRKIDIDHLSFFYCDEVVGEWVHIGFFLACFKPGTENSFVSSLSMEEARLNENNYKG